MRKQRIFSVTQRFCCQVPAARRHHLADSSAGIDTGCSTGLEFKQLLHRISTASCSSLYGGCKRCAKKRSVLFSQFRHSSSRVGIVFTYLNELCMLGQLPADPHKTSDKCPNVLPYGLETCCDRYDAFHSNTSDVGPPVLAWHQLPDQSSMHDSSGLGLDRAPCMLISGMQPVSCPLSSLAASMTSGCVQHSLGSMHSA